MPRVREPFIIQHRSHVWRESSQGSRGVDSLRDAGSAVAQNATEVSRTQQTPYRSNRLVPVVKRSCGKSSTSTWTPFMLRSSSVTTRNCVASPWLSHGKATARSFAQLRTRPGSLGSVQRWRQYVPNACVLRQYSWLPILHGTAPSLAAWARFSNDTLILLSHFRSTRLISTSQRTRQACRPLRWWPGQFVTKSARN